MSLFFFTSNSSHADNVAKQPRQQNSEMKQIVGITIKVMTIRGNQLDGKLQRFMRLHLAINSSKCHYISYETRARVLQCDLRTQSNTIMFHNQTMSASV